MAILQPDRLYDLPSGLWAVDAVRRVAAILTPDRAPRLVSWTQLPPSHRPEPWPPGRVLDDGECLWAQSEQGGPLVRIGPEGVRLCAWTDGLWLAAAGAGAAWCSAGPPPQELVVGSDATPAPREEVGSLLRLDASGRSDTLEVESPVHHVQPGPDSLFVLVESGEHTLRHLGCEDYEVDRATTWLALPWDAPLPQALRVDEHRAPVAPTRRWADGGQQESPWHDLASTPVEAHARCWRAGQDPVRRDGEPQVLVTAHADDGSLTDRWDLGAGQVRALIAHGDGVALSIVRRWRAPGDGGRPQVLTLTPGEPRPRLLLDDPLDVTDLVPLTRPPDADSYLEAMLARYPVPDLTGVSDGVARLVGRWPDSRVEWTFTHPSRPGLVLRRRRALFDEIGRLHEPHYCDVHLMEDLDTGALPPAQDARDGVLDI